jgi:hypothetical protein
LRLPRNPDVLAADFADCVTLRSPGLQAAAADPTGIGCQSQQYSNGHVLKKTRIVSAARRLRESIESDRTE